MHAEKHHKYLGENLRHGSSMQYVSVLFGPCESSLIKLSLSRTLSLNCHEPKFGTHRAGVGLKSGKNDTF